MSTRPRPSPFGIASLTIGALLILGACNNSSSSSPSPLSIGIAPEPIVVSTDVLPGVVVTIDDVRGSGGSGKVEIGDAIAVDFSVRTDAGQPLELATMARAAIMVSGPTSDYQRVIASQGDVIARSTKRALGAYTYVFGVPVPATYLAPLNDTTALTMGELTGQPLQSGTYTVGIEIRKDYTLGGILYRDPGNASLDFLLGGATTLQKREVVTLANCNQCHTELRAHGDNRNKLTNCLLCHTAGAEDRNTATVANGTPGVTIDFKVMIHKIHSGKHLPSVRGVGTNPVDGSRDYNVTAKPYQLIGFGDDVANFSDVTWPSWPSFYTPMPRDTGFNLLSATQQTTENTIRQGPTECWRCHGDPDGSGPLPAPAQGDVIYSRPSIQACGSCHDDWDHEQVYKSNGQTMPIQRDNVTCTQCHRTSGTPLDVIDAHRHPLVDDNVVSGVNFVVSAVRDVGNANGRFEPGEKVEIVFDVRTDAGAAIAASSLSRIEMILSGPTTNPQVINYQRAAPAFFSGNGPYTVRMPNLYWYVPIGTSNASANTFAIPNAPIWNVTGAATTVLRRTGTGATAVLAAGAPVTQNYIDVTGVSGTFVKDDYLVLDDADAGLREYMRIQWVQGNRLWFGSQFRQSYKPNLLKPHVLGATVKVVTTETVDPARYAITASSGLVTETTEFGAGEILANYTADFVVPAAYPGALDDSPVNGQDWGDWTGLPLLDGTYKLAIHGARTLTVTRFGEATSYTEGANSTITKLLFGAATQIQDVVRISDQSCYGCHQSLQFHGGSRRSVDACLQCHGTAGAENTPLYENQTSGSFGKPVEFRYLLHQLHENVFPAMPGGVQDCAKCHGTNTAWKQPAARTHPQQTVPTRAWRAACSSCHSEDYQLAHIDANTSGRGAESCAICHGAGRILEVELMHRVK